MYRVCSNGAVLYTVGTVYVSKYASYKIVSELGRIGTDFLYLKTHLEPFLYLKRLRECWS